MRTRALEQIITKTSKYKAAPEIGDNEHSINSIGYINLKQSPKSFK